MRSVILISVVCLCCRTTPNETAIQDVEPEKSRPDSITTESKSSPNETTTSPFSAQTEANEIIIENEFFVSDLYDFPLNVDRLVELLGSDATVTKEDHEGGEDDYGRTYDGYSYYTVAAGETSISFYSFDNFNNTATITTPNLQLKDGIRIGMAKSDFMERWVSIDTTVSANIFTFNAQYGYAKFIFQADTLGVIEVYYSEGD